MDPNKAILVCCITLVLVIGINVAIYVSVTRKNTVGQIELLRRAARQARNPWGKEDKDLQELAATCVKDQGITRERRRWVRGDEK